MKRALITGITGQDGVYLARFLLDKGYAVYGTFRRLSTPNFWRLQYLDIFDRVTLIPADIIDSSSIVEAIEVSEPDEIYHLAAQSYVGASFEQPVGTGEITGLGVTRLLEAVRQLNPKIKVYQASTSELFGNSGRPRQDEETPFAPTSPYAAAKLYGYWMAKMYREAYGLFTCNGILFNHESPVRGLEFVTRKISNNVAKIALGLQDSFALGNVEAKRDWGYAPEYVESMWLMLQRDQPGDFVVSTGETHSVREFTEHALRIAGLDWDKHVRTDPRFLRPLEVNYLCGDCARAAQVLGWTPKVRFAKLVEIMVGEDLRRWKAFAEGERFPWDAPSYPTEATLLTRLLNSDGARAKRRELRAAAKTWATVRPSARTP
ncbi:MAG: GDP-mannose 4,6-dehydratase [Chloroflexi bacterium]|nr:GDP-mannose 4,6-dehydratase [Chloroflexota bacterium]